MSEYVYSILEINMHMYINMDIFIYIKYIFVYILYKYVYLKISLFKHHWRLQRDRQFFNSIVHKLRDNAVECCYHFAWSRSSCRLAKHTLLTIFSHGSDLYAAVFQEYPFTLSMILFFSPALNNSVHLFLLTSSQENCWVIIYAKVNTS